MKKILTICFLFILITNCEEDVTLNPDGFTEFPVNIQGSWTVNKATQNGNDITEKLNFETFSINLNYEGNQPSTFTIPTFNVPFGIDFSSGTWKFNDITYPTALIFTDNNGISSTVEFSQIPVNSGTPNLKLKFKLGCDANTYIYSFNKN